MPVIKTFESRTIPFIVALLLSPLEKVYAIRYGNNNTYADNDIRYR